VLAYLMMIGMKLTGIFGASHVPIIMPYGVVAVPSTPQTACSIPRIEAVRIAQVVSSMRITAKAVMNTGSTAVPTATQGKMTGVQSMIIPTSLMPYSIAPK
jgi:hypothetical protein